MPQCMGTGNNPCPQNKNGRKVSCNDGDLWLCKSCKQLRLPTDGETLVKPTYDVNAEVDNAAEESGIRNIFIQTNNNKYYE